MAHHGDCGCKKCRDSWGYSSNDWSYGGYVDDEPAKVRTEGDRTEALWGGEGRPDGENHGHIVTNDGINAASVRYPGEKKDAMNNPEDKRRR